VQHYLVAGHTKRRRCPKNTHSLWFTCIERALNGFLDIQDAYNAPQIIKNQESCQNLFIKG
jgi:hypothetical protein